MHCLITAIVILLVGVASLCSSVCGCTINGVVVDCSNRELDSVPADLPINIDRL